MSKVRSSRKPSVSGHLPSGAGGTLATCRSTPSRMRDTSREALSSVPIVSSRKVASTGWKIAVVQASPVSGAKRYFHPPRVAGRPGKLTSVRRGDDMNPSTGPRSERQLARDRDGAMSGHAFAGCSIGLARLAVFDWASVLQARGAVGVVKGSRDVLVEGLCEASCASRVVGEHRVGALGGHFEHNGALS